MTEFLSHYAWLVILGGLIFLAFVVRLNPKWLKDKSYIDQHGNEVPCGCRACTVEAR